MAVTSQLTDGDCGGERRWQAPREGRWECSVAVRARASLRLFAVGRVGHCICTPREPPLGAVGGVGGGRRAPDATVEEVGPGCVGLPPPGLESLGDSPRGEAGVGPTVGAASARIWRQRGGRVWERGVARRCARHTKPLPEPRDASASCDWKGPSSSESAWGRDWAQAPRSHEADCTSSTRRQQGAPSA